MQFSDLGLSPDVLRAVEDAGYTEPTPIQAQAIPIVLMGRDVLGCAQTGTGKTASFVLPMIEILTAGRARARMPRSLIIEPTRELAAQVDKNFATYGKYHKLSTALLIGGTSFADQERALDRGVDVLIATPGRLIDLFERGKILLTDVKILVIDEADRMLDMGFIPDVERIVGLLPKIRQTLFFSATMPPEIRRLADAFLLNPKEISVAPPASPAATVDHALVMVPPREKRHALRALIEAEEVKNALIFCNRKRDISAVVRDLTKHGLPAAELHGDMSQPKRTETLEAFREGEIRLLVASDVAARGLDIRELSHVFLYDVPHNAEDYIHRIGRTGRAGRRGHAFTIATPEDERYIAAIRKLIGRPIERVQLPGVKTAAPEEAEAKAPERKAPESKEAEAEAGKREGPARKGRRRRGRRGKGKAAEDTGRGRRPERPAGKPRGKPSGRDKAAKRDGGGRKPEKQPEEPALGEGEDLPGFLRRPIPMPDGRKA